MTKPKRKPRKAEQAAAAREAKRAQYFTPGNVVKGYGGLDRVLAYRPQGEGSRDGAWEVQVQRVAKRGDGFEPVAGEHPRWHSTEPEAKDLAAGPVARAPATGEAMASRVNSTGVSRLRGMERFGTGIADVELAERQVDGLIGVPLRWEIRADESLGGSTPAAYDRTAGAVLTNKAFFPFMSQAQAVTVLTEEFLHGVDSLSDQRTLMAGSARLAPDGDIRAEVEAKRGSNREAQQFLAYPLDDPRLDQKTVKTELFARLGVLYFNDPDAFRSTFPTTYEAYHEVFGLQRDAAQGSDFVLRERAWRSGPVGDAQGGVQSGPARQIRERLAQRADGKPADPRLGQLRAQLAQVFGAPARGGVFGSRLIRNADPADAPARARRGSGEGIDLASARDFAKSLTDQGLVTLNVVQSVADMPAQPRERVLALAPDGRVRGAYLRQGDAIWMVADHIRGADEFVSVALHEAFHRGLARTIPEAKPVLQQMWRTNRALRAATAEQQRAHGIGRAEAIEEALAVMAERGEARDLTGWGKLLEVIRSWLGKVADAVGVSMTWTDDMVADFVAGMTREGLQGGVHVNQAEGAGAALSRAPFADTVDALKTTATRKGLANLYNDLTKTQAGFNWWHKTIGTQYAKAKRNADFGRVYNRAQDYLHDTSAFANDAAGQAPDLLPQLNGWRDLLRPIALKEADRATVSKAVFEGTLNWTRNEAGELVESTGDEPAGVVFTDAELERMGLGDEQRKLYRQFRASVDRSLDLMAAADAVRYLADDIPQAMKQMVSDGDVGRFKGLVSAMLADKAETAPDKARWATMRDHIADKYSRIDELKGRGYAPLMRFGRYSVYVTRDAGGAEPEQVYFGLYETEREANKAARDFTEMHRDDPGVQVRQGLMSEQAHKLFAGMDPETVAVFADLAGMERTEEFEAYLKLALANRSALKRLIRRKGVAGFSEDVSRVLASFITSNARAASSSMHLGDIAAAVGDMRQRHVAGDVLDEAIKLKDYVQNPTEEAQGVRGLLFVQYLGGLVASALVNMTQPLTMTYPYLSQFGGPAKAAARLAGAIKQAAAKVDESTELGQALAKAEKEGVVSPQEIHQLQAEASRNVGNRPWVRKTLFLWGSLFSLAEQFNRRSTFIAAWNTAKAEGMDDPFRFASEAVGETQGVYNRANKPNWARGALGGTLFTFKQFSISYLEFLSRLPTREKALALAILMLTAGAQGLPGADDLDDLVDTLAQQSGYDFNSRKAKDRFLTSVLGRGGADFIMHGFSAIPGFPLDVSGRMSVGNLIPGTGLMLKSETDKGRGMQEVLGPAGGFAADLMKMADSRDLMQAVPVALRNLGKGIDMMQTGEYRDTRGRKVRDVTPAEAVTKMVGFQPAEVARDSREMSDKRQQVSLAKVIESEIAGEWAAGLVERDPKKVEAARERLRQWNADNPNSRIGITPQQIARRAREIRMPREERFMKSVPKEMRGTLQ